MGFFDKQQQNQGGRQMDRAQFQAQAQQDFDAIRANPDPFIERAHAQIPEELRRDPRAMCMHLINSGQVPQGRMRAAQPLLNMLRGRRYKNSPAILHLAGEAQTGRPSVRALQHTHIIAHRMPLFKKNKPGARGHVE